MHSAQSSLPEPTRAVILCQEKEDATRAKVLLGSSQFRTYAEDEALHDITKADHLWKAVKARARAYYPDLMFVGPAKVYDYNPTDSDSQRLQDGIAVQLREGREELSGETVLAHRPVGEFYVIITALEQLKTLSEIQDAQRSNHKLFQSICQQVENTVQDCSYQLPEVFRVPEDHPFASGVNNLFIPCHPLASNDKRPILLMEGIAPQLQDINGTIIDVEPIRLISDDEKQQLRQRMSSRPTVLFGVSGSGKTQMICEMMAEEYGLLFVAHQGENGGCADLVAAVSDLASVLCEPPIDSTDEAHQQVLDRNMLLAAHCFQAVVLARLMLLRALQKKLGGSLSPGLWLWMQLYPDYIFQSSPEVAELFHSLWRKCRNLLLACITDQCRSLTRDILGQHSFGLLPCFLDEAQMVLQDLRNTFASTADIYMRQSCLFALVETMRRIGAGPVVAGTELRMVHQTISIANGMGGKPGLFLENFLLGRRGYLTPEACRAYILRYLQNDERQPSHISSDQLDEICQILQGRPRFTERFVSRCLEEGHRTDLMQLFERYVSMQVTGKPEPSPYEQKPELSIYWALGEMYDRLVASNQDEPSQSHDHAKILAEFKSVALRYAMTGQEQVLHDWLYAHSTGYGMANVGYERGKLTVLFCEPIVARAVCYFFGMWAYQKDWLITNVGNQPALGNEPEAFVALTLFDRKRPVYLADDAAINLDCVPIPEAFHGSWKLWYPEEAIRTGVLGCDSKQDDALENFLGDDPRHALLFPDVYAGSDVFGRLCGAKNMDRRLQASLQMNFRVEVRDWAGAIRSTSQEDIFTCADGTEVNSRSEVRQRVLEVYRTAGLPLLRVVVAYPETLDDVPTVQVISDTELVLIIDSRNAGYVFNKSELKLLDELFKASSGRTEQQQPASPEAGASREAKKRAASSPGPSTASLPKRRLAHST